MTNFNNFKLSVIKKDDYIVKYYNHKHLKKNLPRSLNVQIKPAIKENFLIFVLCDCSQLN